jgi:hypothetical protein
MSISAGQNGPVANAVIERLFPAAQQYTGGSNYGPDWEGTWLRERRVAHREILDTYLDKIVSDDLHTFNSAEKAYSISDDREALNSYLRSLAPLKQEDVIHSLEAFEGRFKREAIIPTSQVLLDLMSDLPERERAMSSFLDARLVVTRVVLRLVRQLTEDPEREAVILEIYDSLESPAARLNFVQMVGHRQNSGHKLVDESVASDLEKQVIAQIRNMSAEDLLQQSDPFELLWAALIWSASTEPIVPPAAPVELHESIFMAAQTETRSQTLGSRAVRHSPRLFWKGLLDIYGGEGDLRKALEDIRPRTSSRAGLAEVVALADRYLGGWEPERDE